MSMNIQSTCQELSKEHKILNKICLCWFNEQEVRCLSKVYNYHFYFSAKVSYFLG